MTPLTKEAVVQWLLDVDDPWELMRVNWQQHDPFTQSGMWQVNEDLEVNGIRLVMDFGFDKRGFLLSLDDGGIPAYLAIATYGPKCRECGAIPYDAMVCDALVDENEVPGAAYVDTWAVTVIHGMVDNAQAGIDPGYHNDGCPLAVTDEEDEDDE